MANVTKIPDLQYTQWSRVDAESPRLSAPISATDTTILVTNPPLDKDGKIVSKAFILNILNEEGYVESIYSPTNAVQGYGNTPDSTNLGTTITGVTRGINLCGLDITTGVAGRATAHKQDSPVFFGITALVQDILVSALQGGIATGGTSLGVGNLADDDIYYYAKNADTNKPYLKYDKTTNKWLLSNDGTTTYDISAGGSGVTAGKAITITAGVVDVSPTKDTDVFVKTSSGAGDENKAPILNSSGKLATGFITAGTLASYISDVTASKDELNVLDNISANVTATNLNTLTGGGDADALHIHSGALIASGYASYGFNDNNANENYDTTIALATGLTAGTIEIDGYVYAYGSTTSYWWKTQLITSGITCVAQITDPITLAASSSSTIATSYQNMVANGTNQRSVLFSVTSITAGSGNDVVIRMESTITGSPGTNLSNAGFYYKIFQA